MGQNKRLLYLLEIVMAGVLAYLIGLLPTTNGSGLGVNLGVIPLYVIAIRHNMRAGMYAGFLFGMIQLLTGQATILTPVQVFIEYFFAFMMAGFAGTFAPQIKKALDEKKLASFFTWVGASTFIGMFVQYFVHFLAGYFFWRSYAPKGMNPWMYSLMVNGGTGLATWVVAAIAVGLLLKTAPVLYQPKK